MASIDAAIDVDADATTATPRILSGTCGADAPLVLESDSDDEKREPPAKRAKLAPAPASAGNVLLAQLRNDREAVRGAPPPAPAAPPPPQQRQTSIESFALSAVTQSARDVPGRIDRGFARIVNDVITAGDAAELTRLAGEQRYKLATHRGSSVKKRNGLRTMVTSRRLTDEIFHRLLPFLQERKTDSAGAEWQLVGLNERLRFLKYNPGQFFLQHPDGHFSRNRNERSFVTLLLYLNEGYRGGHTTIWNRLGGQSSRPEDGIVVPPRTGMALVHDHRLLHESPELREGVKHVIRTDIMYRRL